MLITPETLSRLDSMELRARQIVEGFTRGYTRVRIMDSVSSLLSIVPTTQVMNCAISIGKYMENENATT